METNKVNLDHAHDLWMELDQPTQKEVTLHCMKESLGSPILIFSGDFGDKEQECVKFVKQFIVACERGDWSVFGIDTPDPVKAHRDEKFGGVTTVEDEESDDYQPDEPEQEEEATPDPDDDEEEESEEVEDSGCPVADEKSGEDADKILAMPKTKEQQDNDFLELFVDAVIVTMRKRGLLNPAVKHNDVHDAVNAAMANGAFPEQRVRDIAREEARAASMELVASMLATLEKGSK